MPNLTIWGLARPAAGPCRRAALCATRPAASERRRRLCPPAVQFFPRLPLHVTQSHTTRHQSDHQFASPAPFSSAQTHAHTHTHTHSRRSHSYASGPPSAASPPERSPLSPSRLMDALSRSLHRVRAPPRAGWVCAHSSLLREFLFRFVHCAPSAHSPAALRDFLSHRDPHTNTVHTSASEFTNSSLHP